MTREWEKFSNDEIACIWNGYLQTEFKGYDPLRTSSIPGCKHMKLTPMDILRLVEVLMRRLETKFPDDFEGVFEDEWK